MFIEYGYPFLFLQAANTHRTGHQLWPDVLGLSNGGLVVAYNNPDNAIRLDFYDANLNLTGPVGGRYPADIPPVAIFQPSLTQLANGNVLVVWEDNTPASPGLRGHLYSPTGNSIGTELTFGTADLNFSDPQVVALKNGDFVLSYNYLSTVVYSVFDASGAFKTGVAVNPTPPMLDTAVAALADGGFVVTYTDETVASNWNIRARIYNADGSVRTADVTIDGGTGHQRASKVVGLPNGNFAVVYEDAGWTNESGTTGISLKIHGPTGAPVRLVQVNDPSAVDEVDPDVAVLPNGFINVTWARLGSDHTIRNSIFDSNYVPIFDEGTIAGGGAVNFDRRGTAASSVSGNKFIVAWHSNEPDPATDASGYRISTTVLPLSRDIFGDNASDTFIGDELPDEFRGGGGSNTFVIRPGGSHDSWLDFVAGPGTADKVNLTGYGNIHNLAGVLARTTDIGGHAVIDFGGVNSLTLGPVKASLHADDFVFAPLNDFNGDGKSDVLFSLPGVNFNSDYMWQMNDRSIASQGAIDLYDKTFNVQVVGDFDGDGKSDVLFRNPTTGGVWQWLLNGTAIKSQGAVDVADPGFALLGSADFNGDGKSDLLFRNAAGFVYMWQMNGKVNTPLAVGALDPSWHVAGAGDFDLDGKADILLHNISGTPANGAYFLWKMNGNQIIGQGGIERPDASWHTLAIGDFDGDGKSDFAIRNVSATGDNGAVWVYLMDGTAIKSQGAAGIVRASEFNTVGVGDYNGDGKDDILFRSNAGYFYSWDMNGKVILTEGPFGTQAGNHADPSFAVVTQHWDLL